MEEFSSTLGEISKDIVVSEVSLLPTFQAIQIFKGLPDFLIFPAFLALRYPVHPRYAQRQCDFPSSVHAMKIFIKFAKGAQERSQCASDALNYACQYWAIHLSRAPNSRDDMLNNVFKAFWDCHLLSWLERQWCLKGLCSSCIILSEGLELAKEHFLASANKRKANDQDIISDACLSKRARH
ncbi:hypothetical protein K503DRAFT_301230 [Rhizopogon vinicolor AM-OR11-026]|uniref:Uncharacterized protein n=1 Tax=Rhizopogon vinicolor AM-OR11-026 TaxID=1314800 RepID=A0A1B7MUV7_9AGAM|nr:hypothetical protein K503DRAFT_301230 [Rhizopogon vinicolor AM-OR11-026]